MTSSVKNIYRFLFIVALCIAPAGAFAQDPTSREYPYLYKSTRAMGMGGAYTAVGGRVDSLFYNPAGLINIPQDKGWEVNLINVSAEVNQNALNFVKDMQDALKTEDLNGDGNTGDDQMRATNDVLAKYRGDNLHLRAADFTSVGKSFDKFAFGVGGVGSLRADAMTHQGFGPEGLLELNADATYGAIAGVSVGVTDALFIGLSAKSLHRELIVHDFTARELVDHQNNLSDYIQKDLKKSGNGVGFDTGLIWKFDREAWLRPALGVSALNIGDMSLGDAGKLPMSINAGLSINPQISAFRSLIFGVDYIDVLNNFQQDKDLLKRLRLGGELQLFDIWPVELALRAGVYEGYLTYGADVRLLFITVSYAAYSEEVGAYSGQEQDKRQLLTLNIGW